MPKIIFKVKHVRRILRYLVANKSGREGVPPIVPKIYTNNSQTLLMTNRTAGKLYEYNSRLVYKKGSKTMPSNYNIFEILKDAV